MTREDRIAALEQLADETDGLLGEIAIIRHRRHEDQLPTPEDVLGIFAPVPELPELRQIQPVTLTAPPERLTARVVLRRLFRGE